MGISQWLRGPASLVALSASYAWRRPAKVPAAAFAAARIAMRVRRAPVLRPDLSPLAEPGEITPVCSLVSDCHLIAPGRSLCELDHEPWQWPWGAPPDATILADGLRRVLEHIGRHAPRTVIWCGDEVDSGAAAEWEQWRTVVDAVPGLAHRVVPGNHDICFNRPFDADHDLARRRDRERAFERHAGALGELPIVDPIVGDAGPATVILLDSCRFPSTHVLSNAIGQFGRAQLRDLGAILARLSGPVLVIAHHHVWRDERFLEPEPWYNVAVDSDALIALLAAYRRGRPRNDVLVCHGHRHALTAGVVGDADAPIRILGLPSTTLGDKSRTGKLDGVLRYAVAGLRKTGQWAISLHDVGVLAASGARLDGESPSSHGDVARTRTASTRRAP